MTGLYNKYHIIQVGRIFSFCFGICKLDDLLRSIYSRCFIFIFIFLECLWLFFNFFLKWRNLFC